MGELSPGDREREIGERDLMGEGTRALGEEALLSPTMESMEKPSLEAFLVWLVMVAWARVAERRGWGATPPCCWCPG